MTAGSISIVGLGYRIGAHVTVEAMQRLERADVVLHLVSDRFTLRWLDDVNPSSRTLLDCYEEGAPTVDAIEPMVELALAPARAGERVCVAFPGHPSIVVPPCHAIVRRASEEGIAVEVLPGLSAPDCLFADLGFDPANGGYAVYETTELLTHEHAIDPHAHLVLLQAGVIGVREYYQVPPDPSDGLARLRAFLSEVYPDDHEVVLYGIESLPLHRSRIERVALADLAEAGAGHDTTVYVPPLPRQN